MTHAEALDVLIVNSWAFYVYAHATSSRDKNEDGLTIAEQTKAEIHEAMTVLKSSKSYATTLRNQILQSLTRSPLKTSEILHAVSGHPTAVKNELKRLLAEGEISKVRHGVYTLKGGFDNATASTD